MKWKIFFKSFSKLVDNQLDKIGNHVDRLFKWDSSGQITNLQNKAKESSNEIDALEAALRAELGLSTKTNSYVTFKNKTIHFDVGAYFKSPEGQKALEETFAAIRKLDDRLDNSDGQTKQD